MPSLTHEALLLLFRNRPELAPELLRDALHLTLPHYAEVRVESSDLSDLAPAEYRADLVVLLVDGKPVLGIVVEVQLPVTAEHKSRILACSELAVLDGWMRKAVSVATAAELFVD